MSFTPFRFDASAYAYNPMALPMAATFMSALAIGTFVLLRERFSTVSRAFFLMTLPAAVWCAAFTGMYLAVEEALAIRWAKVAYWAIPFIPSAIHWFTVNVLRIAGRRRERRIAAAGLAAAAASSAVLTQTDWFMTGLHHYAWGYYPAYSPASAIYLAYFFGLMAYSLSRYAAQRRKPHTPAHEARIRWLFVAFCVAYLAILDYLPKFGLDWYPLGSAAILCFLAIAAWVTTRYRLVDITTSFAAEKILRSIGDAVLVLDTENFVRVANDAACRLFGQPRERLLGIHLAQVSPRFPVRDTPATVGDVGEDHVYEMSHETEQGKALWLRVAESAIKDHLGCVAATVLVIRDQTDLKAAQTELRDTESRFAELCRGLPDAVLVLDEFGRFRSVNPAAERLLETTQEEAVGRIFVLSNYLAADGVTRILRAIRNVMHDGSDAPFTFDLQREGGRRLRLEAHPSAVHQQGRIVGVQLVLRSAEAAAAAAARASDEALQRELLELKRHNEELQRELLRLRHIS
jgi:PAS domain S-box-containing protein